MEHNEDLFSVEVLEDFGVDALGAAGTSCSNNTSNGSADPPVEEEIIVV